MRVLLVLLGMVASATGLRDSLGHRHFRSPGSTVKDYTESALLTGPAAGAQCANANITLDQGGAVTVSRASSAYCQKADGTMVLVGSNKPVLEPDGLGVWAPSTNLIPDTTNMGSWTPTNADSNGPIDYYNLTSAGNEYTADASGGYWESASFTITGTTATASLFARAVSGTQAFAFTLRDTTGSADVCTYTGTATTTWSAMKGRPACSGTTTSGHTHVLRIYAGGLSGTSSGTQFFGPQVETSTYQPTSFIQSSGTAVSRSADVVSVTITNNTSKGCVSALYTNVIPEPNARVFSTAAGDLIGVANHIVLFANDGSSTTFGNAVEMQGLTTTVRNAWSGSALSLSANGNATSGSFDGTIGGTTLYLGSNGGALQFLNGWLKGVKVSTDPKGCK